MLGANRSKLLPTLSNKSGPAANKEGHTSGCVKLSGSRSEISCHRQNANPYYSLSVVRAEVPEVSQEQVCFPYGDRRNQYGALLSDNSVA
jgi:hypothetical protein